MFNAIGEKLEKIRNSSETVKKKWVIGMSAICMLIVVLLWFTYINDIVKPASTQENQEVKSDFWPIFKNGLGMITGEIKGKLGAIISSVLGERNIEIRK